MLEELDLDLNLVLTSSGNRAVFKTSTGLPIDSLAAFLIASCISPVFAVLDPAATDEEPGLTEVATACLLRAAEDGAI